MDAEDSSDKCTTDEGGMRCGKIPSSSCSSCRSLLLYIVDNSLLGEIRIKTIFKIKYMLIVAIIYPQI